MRHFLASLLEVVEVALVALGAVFLIRTFLIQPFLVSGASMVPTFENGDYLLIDEVTYRFREPARGEVVVFKYPNDTSTYFIKRIVGLPGERLEFTAGGVRVTNADHPEGFLLDERYLPLKTFTAIRAGGRAQFTLGAGEHFVLGDNRSYSYDSRDWGVLPAEDIIGIVRMRLWPVGDFGVFASPAYDGAR